MGIVLVRKIFVNNGEKEMSNSTAGRDYVTVKNGLRGTKQFTNQVIKRKKKNKRAKASRKKNR